VASNGKEALDFFEKNKYDLIITSIDMPVMNGLDLISKIREVSRHITIIVLSSQEKYFVDFIRLGIDGYILNPIEVEQFVNIMQKVIETLHNKQALYEYRLDLEKKVDEKTKKLQDLNTNLKEKVKEEVEKNLEHEKHINAQARLVSMGEMISNIAHQWRQPLSTITTLSTGASFKKELNVLSDKEFYESMEIINTQSQYLSETIDTFRDFIKQDKVLKETILQKRISIALNIVNATIKDHHIKLIDKIDYKDPIKIKLILGELSQVIINIINNAKDILVEKKIDEPWIKIDLKKKKDKAIITIEDNAGGMSEEVKQRIFEPYFTTKHESQGTGLGLYMSYKIITQSLMGDLYVENTKHGAKFYIELPLNT
jgi:two-component system C4-dicarboxylate transport sensor histidine kinase DctB